MVYNWSNYIQALWPSHCLLCGAPGRPGVDLCRPCQDHLVRNTHPCARCALPLPAPAPAGSLCGACQRHPPSYDRVLAPYRYQAPLSQLIVALKYAGRLASGRLLGQLLAAELGAATALRLTPPQALLPVPLHRRRLRSRGFNQAAELAGWLSRELRIPLALDALRRVEDTPAQAGLHRAERLRNLRGAFRWVGPAGLRHVVLIDDVVTTGATAEALARVLRQSGVDCVELWAVARTAQRPR